MELHVVASSLLYAIGVYGFVIGIGGIFAPQIAARLGADLAGSAPYASMASLGLFGFVGGGALITLTFGTSGYLPHGIGMLLAGALFAALFWATGASPALLYRAISRVRLRFDGSHSRRRRYGAILTRLLSLRRTETHDEKIQNTIGTSSVLAVAVTVINAVLAAKLWGVEYESGGEVFAVVSSILVLTTVFAAGALQRFDAWK